MTAVQRFRNKYRLQLREKDHELMHVHLVAGTLPAGLKAEASAWLRSHQADLIKEWKQWQR